MVGLLAVAAILGLVGWRAGWLGVDGLGGTWARWLDASPSSTAPDRPLDIRPTISGVFSPEPAKVQAVLDRLKPGPEANLSTLQHALHLFGREARVPAKGTGEPVSIVELFLDADRAVRHFGGAKTIAPTRHGARFPEYAKSMMGTDQSTAEGHPGETLAVLAGVGVPLSHPTRLSAEDSATLQAVFEDVMANLVLEGEIYWQVAALALYLPPRRTWKDKFGRQFSFDDLARELLRRPVLDSSCAGTHGLISLTTLLRADQEHPVLSGRVRQEVGDYLAKVVQILVEGQQAEGWWSPEWHRPLTGARPDPLLANPPDPAILVATGHHLEWLMMLPDHLRPPDEVLRKAGTWLLEVLQRHTADPKWVQRWYCPASHGARSVVLLARAPEE